MACIGPRRFLIEHAINIRPRAYSGVIGVSSFPNHNEIAIHLVLAGIGSLVVECLHVRRRISWGPVVEDPRERGREECLQLAVSRACL